MPLKYSRWKHRITFALSPVTTVGDRWVTLTLPWRPGIKSDFSDIRFTDTAGNSLSYNITSKTDRVTATIKIGVPIAGTRLIHCYFGNSQAVSESTAAGTEDTDPVLTAASGTTNPGYSGTWTLRQGGRLNQQKYLNLRKNRLSRWRYKRSHSITSATSLTDYQVKIRVYRTEGTSTGDTVYLGSKCLANYGDIRFVASDGTTELSYWMEVNAGTYADFWVKVPSITTDSSIWIYYGNESAVSESDGNNTFVFFDDFNGTSLDTTKWDVVKLGSSSAVVKVDGSGLLELSGLNGTTSSGNIVSKVTITKPFILEVKEKVSASAGGYSNTSFGNTNTTQALNGGTSWWHTLLGNGYIFMADVGANGRIFKEPLGSSSFTLLTILTGRIFPTNDTYYRNQYIATSSSFQFTRDGTSYGSISDSSYTGPYYICLSQGEYGPAPASAGYRYIDWAFIRKYTATEPTHSTWSEEQSNRHLLNWIIAFETLGTQPGIEGNHYIMDPIESSLSLAGSIGSTVLQPFLTTGLMFQPSGPVAGLSTLIDTGLSLSGNVLGKFYIPLDELDLTQFSVGRAVSDDIWAMSATIDGYQILNLDVLRHATFATTDHVGISHSIFAGILPRSNPSIQEAANKTTITGYDYAWYLARQKVPAEYQHNTAAPNPAGIIRGLLGGDNWQEVTGIEPYHIMEVAAWGDTLNRRVFDFPIGTTKKQAIEKICNYCRFIFQVKWRVDEDGVATAAAYFVSEDDIDTELDLPSSVTFAYPDPYLTGKINIVRKGDERYNRVTVIGRDNAGGVFFSTAESPDVAAGDELAVELIENSGSWTTQTQVDARATELFGYYNETAYTYSATLLDRMDLELLQKIKITGYTGVSENWMRITKIKKTVSGTQNGVEKRVEIEFTENVKWSALKRMYRYASDDMTSEIETIAGSMISQIPGPQVGVVDSLDGQEAIIMLEDGSTVTARGV